MNYNNTALLYIKYTLPLWCIANITQQTKKNKVITVQLKHN